MELADYLLPGLIIAFVAWRLVAAVLARRRVPELLEEGAQRAASCAAAGLRVSTTPDPGGTCRLAAAGSSRPAVAVHGHGL